MTGKQASSGKAKEPLSKEIPARVASVANDAQRLTFFIGGTLFPILEALAHIIPGKKGESIAKIIKDTQERFSPAWNFHDGSFESVPPLLPTLNSETKKFSKMDGLHIISGVQEIALTVAGIALGMPALGAVGFAASSWVAVADAAHQYGAAKRRTNLSYLAQKKREEIEKLKGETVTDPAERQEKIKLLATQAAALRSLARTEKKELEPRFSKIRGKNNSGTSINGQYETTLESEQKTALANALIQEQKDIMESCKKELLLSIATAVVMTAMAAVIVLANVVVIAAAVAAAPYLPLIIGPGLAIAAAAVGVVKFAQVLDNRLYTSKAMNHATKTARKTEDQLLEDAVKKQGLDLPTAKTSLSEPQQKSLIEQQARKEYSKSGVVSDLKAKASAAFCSFFGKTASPVNREQPLAAGASIPAFTK